MPSIPGILGGGGAGGGSGFLGTLYVRLAADATILTKEIDAAEKKVAASSAGIAKSLAGRFATALAAVGAGAAAQAIKFESSFAGVRKTVDATEAQFRELQQAFRDMAKELPTNVNEINRVAEAAGQLGIKAENLKGFTRVMIDLSNTTNLSSDEAATTLARFANVAGTSQKDFDRVGATLVELGNNSATTEREIASMALRIGGAGRIVGLNSAQILGFAAALSSMGIEAEAGGTAISQAFITMAKSVSTGSEELKTFAAVAGLSVADFSKLFKEDATQAMQRFLEGLSIVSKQGGDVFSILDTLQLSGIRMTDSLLRLSGAQGTFNNSLNLAKQAWQDNNALVNEANKRYETTASQLTITWNKFKDLLLTIGEGLLPTVKDFNKELQTYIEWVAKTQKETGFLTATFKTLVDLLKSVVLGVAVVWTALKSIATIIADTVVLQVESLTIAVGGLIRIFDAWWTAGKGVIAGLVQIASAANDASTVLSALFRKDFGAASAAFAAMLVKSKDGMADVTASIAKGITESVDVVTEAASGAWELAAGLGEDAVSDLKQQWSDLADFQKKLFPDLVEGVKTTVPEINKASDAVKNLNDQLKDTGEQIRNIPEISRALDIFKKLGLQMETKDTMGTQFPIGPQLPDIAGIRSQGVNQSFGILNEVESSRRALDELAKIRDEDIAGNQEAINLKMAAIESYNKKLQELSTAQAAIVVQSGEQMFDALGTAIKGFAGEQSAAYKAMFAASKAFAIAESIIKIQQGIASALALPFPANLAAIASVVTAAAGIISTIQQTTLEISGERKMGGPVTSGRAFLVGEAGPEVFVPSVNGDIIPNHELGGGKSNVKVVVQNYTDARPEVKETQSGQERIIEIILRRTKDELASEIRDGRGEVNRALEGSFGLRRGK